MINELALGKLLSAAIHHGHIPGIDMNRILPSGIIGNFQFGNRADRERFDSSAGVWRAIEIGVPAQVIPHKTFNGFCCNEVCQGITS